MTNSGGVASTDGATVGVKLPDGLTLSGITCGQSDEVAESVIAGLAAENFLILPHAEVLTYMQRKTADYDRWLGGMRRLRAKVMGG